MRYSIAVFSVLIAMSLISGCNSLGGQPKFKATTISPENVHPGDRVVIQVAVKDKNQVIDHIEAVVLEDSNITFPLRDDGQDGDEKAGDGVWTWSREIPFQAPPGEYHFEFTAYRDDGIPVEIRTKKGEVLTLQSESAMKISFVETPAP